MLHINVKCAYPQLWSMFTHEFRRKYSCKEFKVISRWDSCVPYIYILPTGYNDSLDIYHCSLTELHIISLASFIGETYYSSDYTFESVVDVVKLHDLSPEGERQYKSMFDEMSKLVYNPHEYLHLVAYTLY